MKVAILAGGLGTRLSEETSVRPKPMVEIGGRPMLWHIMSIYAAQGFREFVVALGYKGEMIKDYFLNYHLRACSLTVELSSGRATVHGAHDDDWIVHLLDTGDETNTGGRIKQVAEFIGDEPFMLTYGDGVADIDLKALVAVPPGARQAGDGHGRAPAGALRRHRLRRRPRPQLRREAAGGRGLGQRRLLRAAARHPRLHRRRPDALGEGADGASGGRGRAGRLPPRVASGTAWTRCATSTTWRACGPPARPRGRCGDRERRASGWTGPRSSPAPPAWSAAGWSGVWQTRAPTWSAWCATGCRRANWCAAAGWSGSRWCAATCATAALLERALGEYEIDTVIHLAAQTIVGIANRNPLSTFETNIGGTWALLEACRRSPQVSRSWSPPPTRPTASRTSCPTAS